MSKRKSPVTIPFGLGNRIKSAREAKGLTQPELGKLIGVSKSAVNQWENGVVQNLKLGNLFAVAQVLGKDVQELVFGGAMPVQVAEIGSAPRYAAVPAQQLALLRAYESLPRNIQHHLRGLLRALGAAVGGPG